MRRIVVVLLLCLFANQVAVAQTPPFNTTAIDSYIQQELNADRIPGLALAIVRQNKIVYMQGYGRTGEEPITPDTSFLLGSMSKSFTAFAVMQLVEQGKLDLNAPAHQYIPWFSIRGETDTITIARLLHHTSGIPENAPHAFGQDQSLQAQVRALSNVTLAHVPGTVFEYSSPNYLVLGAIVEAVSGQSFGDYIQANIFKPLGMTHSYTSRAAARTQGQMSDGHQYWFGIPMVSNLPEEPGRLPTAALISSVSDLARYLMMQQNNGQWEDVRLVSSNSVQQMHTADAPISIYGMGWRASEIHGVPAIHHGGVLPDFRGKMVMLPAQGWGVVVLTNISSFWGEPSSHRIADAIAGMLVGKTARLPDMPLSQLYLLIAGVALVVTLLQVWEFIRIPAWRAKQKQLNANTRFKSFARLMINTAVEIGTLVGLPLVVRINWQTILLQMPDIAYWTLAICGLSLLISLAKLTSLFPLRRQPAQSTKI